MQAIKPSIRYLSPSCFTLSLSTIEFIGDRYTLYMPHSHEAGWEPREISDFTESVFRSATPLPVIGPTEVVDGKFTATFSSDRPVEKAQLLYTRATGQWQDRKFNTLPAKLNGNRVEADIPVNATVAFFTITDDRGALVSSEHLEN